MNEKNRKHGANLSPLCNRIISILVLTDQKTRLAKIKNLIQIFTGYQMQRLMIVYSMFDWPFLQILKKKVKKRFGETEILFL